MKKNARVLLALSLALATAMSSCDSSGSSSPLSGGSIAEDDLLGTWKLIESDSYNGCDINDTLMTTFVAGGSMIDVSSYSFKCSGEEPEYDKNTSTGTWSISHDTLFTVTRMVNATERDTVRFGVKGSNLYIEGREEGGGLMTLKFTRVTP